MFGGSDSSSATAQSTAAINSSGWVVGGGKVNNGGFEVPFIGWLSIAAVGFAFIYYRKKRG